MKYYHGRVRSSMKAKSSCTLPNKMVNCWRGLTDCKKKKNAVFFAEEDQREIEFQSEKICFVNVVQFLEGKKKN